jgi:hypothetical protein
MTTRHLKLNETHSAHHAVYHGRPILQSWSNPIELEGHAAGGMHAFCAICSIIAGYSTDHTILTDSTTGVGKHGVRMDVAQEVDRGATRSRLPQEVTDTSSDSLRFTGYPD